MAIILPVVCQPPNPLIPDDGFYQQDSLAFADDAVKTDPIQFIFGDYSLYYERLLSTRISTEIGGGITRRNYLGGINDYDEDNIARNIDVKTGYAYKVSLRIYMKKSPEIHGFYISPVFSQRYYLKDFKAINSAGELTGKVSEDRRLITDGGLLIGFQKLSLLSNFLLDFYVGVVYRSKDYEIVRQTDSPGIEYSSAPLKENAFAFTGGIKIGLGF